jgi:hypothetical protein
MEYDPAVSTHKASSITSTTSTSSNSTWDHPISSYNIPAINNLKDEHANIEGIYTLTIIIIKHLPTRIARLSL